jgi:hypothetical protein
MSALKDVFVVLIDQAAETEIVVGHFQGCGLPKTLPKTQYQHITNTAAARPDVPI